MIIVTGGAGFIGSNLVKHLNEMGYDDIIVIDSLEKKGVYKNLEGASIKDFLNYKKGFSYILEESEKYQVDSVFHIGANADVLVSDCNVFLEDNFEWSKFWFEFCTNKNIPFIYASSSAVYGNQKDSSIRIGAETPHNEYAFSKALFDQYMFSRRKEITIPWYGFRLFNVYGAGEEHKNKNASLIYRFFSYLRHGSPIELFNENISRDYISVKDVCAVLYKVMLNEITIDNGIYNLGSGCPITHEQIANMVTNVFDEEGGALNMNKIVKIEFPDELRDRFQYYTKANDLSDQIKALTGNSHAKIESYIKELKKK